jgi:regulator of sirC expression with transglutaminase-like and TPR domain
LAARSRGIAAIMAICLWATPCAAGSALPPDIERLLAQPTDEIDIGRAALTLETALPRLANDPPLDVDAYSRQIDDLAQQVKALLQGSTNPTLGVLALDAVLYQRAGFHYDFSRAARMKKSNYFLSGLLDTHTGFCQSMSVLYIAVAQRAGLRAYPTNAPGHTFVRIMGPPLYVQDLDPSSDTYTDDDYYIDRFHITAHSISAGTYLRTKSYRELLGLLTQQTGLAMRGTPDPALRAQSIAYFEKAVELDPRGPEEILTLRIAYDYEGDLAAQRGDMTAAAAYRQKAAALGSRLNQLGYIKGEDSE